MKWLIILFFATVIFVQVSLKYNQKNPINDFFEKERKANNSTKKEINEKYFFVNTLNITEFEFNYSKKYEKLLNDLKIISEKEMIKFNQIYSNTDIKLKFGPSNLNRIMDSENNYREYFRILNDMSEELINNDDYANAEIILKYLIENNSEFSKSYILLINIYKKTYPDKIYKLIGEFETNATLNSTPALRKLVFKNFWGENGYYKNNWK